MHTLNIVLEGGGWPTLLEYVKERLGVAVVTDTVARTSALPGMIVRPLDPKLFPPLHLRLIARRKLGSPDQADLSPAARKFHDALIRAIKELDGGSAS
jgi:DNA-binding transcriptional LysR family regulator